jgi:hypothetical protein
MRLKTQVAGVITGTLCDGPDARPQQVHKLSPDNNVFFKFHPWYFLIKDRQTRSLLLEGKCEYGLYPLKPSDLKSLHQAFVDIQRVRINGMLGLVSRLLQ